MMVFIGLRDAFAVTLVPTAEKMLALSEEEPGRNHDN